MKSCFQTKTLPLSLSEQMLIIVPCVQQSPITNLTHTGTMALTIVPENNCKLLQEFFQTVQVEIVKDSMVLLEVC